MKKMNINWREKKLYLIPPLQSKRPMRIIIIGLLLLISSLDAKLKNAGILPYYYDDYGSAYFLIGQESNGKWSDFGGTAEKTDKNQKYVAAREFSEETRLVFGKYAAGLRDLQRKTKSIDIDYYLQKSIDYIQPRITASVTNPAENYVMYLAHVDFIPERDFNRAIKTSHYEKKRYKWVPVEEFTLAVKKALDRTHVFYKDKQLRRQFYDTFHTNRTKIMQTIYSKNK